jgi:hypothetical protein
LVPVFLFPENLSSEQQDMLEKWDNVYQNTVDPTTLKNGEQLSGEQFFSCTIHQNFINESIKSIYIYAYSACSYIKQEKGVFFYTYPVFVLPSISSQNLLRTSQSSLGSGSARTYLRRSKNTLFTDLLATPDRFTAPEKIKIGGEVLFQPRSPEGESVSVRSLIVQEESSDPSEWQESSRKAMAICQKNNVPLLRRWQEKQITKPRKRGGSIHDSFDLYKMA